MSQAAQYFEILVWFGFAELVVAPMVAAGYWAYRSRKTNDGGSP